MKAKDLMIGDWVLCDINAQSDYEFDNVNYKPYQIQNGEDIDYANERNKIGDADVYQPMPISAYILKKSGFHYNGKMFSLFKQGEYDSCVYLGENSGLFSLIRKDGDLDLNDYFFNYVHELQHVLRLCGVDKEIVL